MNVCDISFDKERFVFDVVYRLRAPLELTFVITDAALGCPYYTWDVTLAQNNSVWISPLHPSMIEVAKTSKTFSGFVCKVFHGKRLLQSVTVPLIKNIKPIQFSTSDFDMVGASYLDFFHGSLCHGIDMSGSVIDAGANVGFFTLLALTKGAHKVYSIEPDVYPFSYLQNNFQTDNRVTLINKALTDNCDGVNFSYSAASVASSAVNPAADSITGYVESLNLDVILAIESHLNLVKLDIEGSEYSVFDSLTSSHFEKVSQWFIEFHNKSTPLVDRLQTEGYQVEYRNCTPDSIVGFLYAYRKNT
jgi:FkbM family methyltransferase